jgi:hypothetical protein
MKRQIPSILLRIFSIIALLAGSIVSIVLVLKGGQHNPSILLIVLFLVWVLSPFAGLVIASMKKYQRTVQIQTILYWLMIFIATISILGYSGILRFSGTKPAFIFLVIPIISWILIITVILIGSRQGKQSSQGEKS